MTFHTFDKCKCEASRNEKWTKRREPSLSMFKRGKRNTTWKADVARDLRAPLWPSRFPSLSFAGDGRETACGIWSSFRLVNSQISNRVSSPTDAKRYIVSFATGGSSPRMPSSSSCLLYIATSGWKDIHDTQERCPNPRATHNRNFQSHTDTISSSPPVTKNLPACRVFISWTIEEISRHSSRHSRSTP